MAKEREDLAAVLDCLVLCKFLRNCFKDFDEDVARIYTMITGIPMTAKELDGGRRARVQPEEGLQHPRRAGPRRTTGCRRACIEDPIPSGPSKGAYVKPEELRMMIDDYYQARGWTTDGLIPKSKLIELGLEDIAERDRRRRYRH